jgi:hypothetical protein
MKIYLETPVKVEKGDLLVVDDVHDKEIRSSITKDKRRRVSS